MPIIDGIRLGTRTVIFVAIIVAACSKSKPAAPAPQPRCGDGVVNSRGETCDDGNLASGDGCDATCNPEYFVLARIDGARSESTLAGWSYYEGKMYYVTNDGTLHSVQINQRTMTPFEPPSQSGEGVMIKEGGSRWSRPSIFAGGAFVFEESDGEWVGQWVDLSSGSVRRTIRTGGSLPVTTPFIEMDETTVIVPWSLNDIPEVERTRSQQEMSAAGIPGASGYYAGFQGMDGSGTYNTMVVTDLESGRTRPLLNDKGLLWRTAGGGVIAVFEPTEEVTYSLGRRGRIRNAAGRVVAGDSPRLVWYALGVPTSSVPSEVSPVANVPIRYHAANAYQSGESWSGNAQAAWRESGSDSLWGLSRLGGGSVTLVRLHRTVEQSGGVTISEEAFATIDAGRTAVLLCVSEVEKRAIVQNQSTIISVDLESRRVSSRDLHVPDGMVTLSARSDDGCNSVAYMLAPSGQDAALREARIVPDLGAWIAAR